MRDKICVGMPIVQCCFLLGRKYKCIPAEVCKYKCITKQMFFQLENVDNLLWISGKNMRKNG